MKRPVDIAAELVNDFNQNAVPWVKGSLALAVAIRIAIEEAYTEGLKEGRKEKVA